MCVDVRADVALRMHDHRAGERCTGLYMLVGNMIVPCLLATGLYHGCWQRVCFRTARAAIHLTASTRNAVAHSAQHSSTHTLAAHPQARFSNITVNTFAPGRLGRHEPPWPWPLRAPGWLCLRRPHPICQGLLAALFSHGLFVGEQTEASREKQTEVQEEDGCGHVQQAWLKQ